MREVWEILYHHLTQKAVHLCKDEDLKSLDMMEAYGIGYDRITVSVLKADGDKVDAITYIGMPEAINDECLPTKRYLSIILSGAESAGLSASYINKLKATPLQENPRLPDFKPWKGSYKNYNQKDLAQNKNLTALSGMVFDMTSARKNLAPVKNLFGGKDMTLFHVKRHDSSDGKETIEKVRNGLISESAKQYLNSYLHEYAKEFKFIGYFTP
jgi:hypothetical protein